MPRQYTPRVARVCGQCEKEFLAQPARANSGSALFCSKSCHVASFGNPKFVLPRFWKQVKVASDQECWVWQKCKSPSGYGVFRLQGKNIPAHRFSWEIANGPMPQELVTDHLCRNHSCVNPAHLEAVTNRENVLRGVAPAALHAKKDHCPQGHSYSGGNLLVVQAKAGGQQRYCRACDAEKHRQQRQAKKQSAA